MYLKFIADIIRNFWALTITVCPFYISEIHGVPVPRWMQPCRGSLESIQELLVPNTFENPQLSDMLIAHRVWMKATELKIIAASLRDQLAQERIQSTDLQLYLDHNTTLSGFPNHRRLHSRSLFIEKLQEDYRRVSIASIFVEHMRIEEEQSSFSPSFTTHFRHIESQIYPLLCQLKVAILGKGEHLPFISSSAIYHSLRNTETHAQRHMRDYRILKDVVRLFRAIQSDYEHIETEDINQPVDDR